MPKISEVIGIRIALARFRGKKFRVKKPARPQPPIGIEKTYAKRIKGLAGDANQIVREILSPRLGQLSAQAKRESGRQDNYTESLAAIMRLVRASYAGIHPESEMTDIARRVGLAINSGNKREVLRIVSGAIGVDVFTTEPWLAGELTAFVKQNVDLIDTIPSRYFSEVEQRVMSGLRSGARVEDMEKEISQRFGVSRSRAELIARDQVGKFNGQLTELRHRELGIEEYIWRTVGDERVRENHESKDGRKFRWSDPPADTGHPGEDFQCRCTAEPVIQI